MSEKTDQTMWAFRATLRASKLLSELDSWFAADNITPPAYVKRQIDQLLDVLSQVPK